MPFFLNGEEVQHIREINEALKHYGTLVTDALAYHRCPMCGCDLGAGEVVDNCAPAYIEYCISEACDYEEYV